MKYQSFCPFVGTGYLPPPTPHACVAPPRTQVEGGGSTHSRRWGGGPNSDEGTKTPVLDV